MVEKETDKINREGSCWRDSKCIARLSPSLVGRPGGWCWMIPAHLPELWADLSDLQSEMCILTSE